MSWKKYTSLLDTLVRHGIQTIAFVGGEPTIWSHIDRGIQLAQHLGMCVALLTNAVKRTQCAPASVMINGNNLTNPKLEALILSNVTWYREHGSQTTLRFNISAADSPALLQRYITWARDYADDVSFSPTVPYSLEKQLGKTLITFAKGIHKNKQAAALSRAVPLCIFTPAQRDYMKQRSGLYSKCAPAKKGFTINPDGTALPCVDLAMPLKWNTTNLTKISANYEPEIKKLYEKPKFESCKTCQYFPRVCQGGCLTMKCGT